MSESSILPAMLTTSSRRSYPKYLLATIVLAILLVIIPAILAFTVPSPSDSDGDAGAGPRVATVVMPDTGAWS
jgi:hypothetical protein